MRNVTEGKSWTIPFHSYFSLIGIDFHSKLIKLKNSTHDLPFFISDLLESANCTIEQKMCGDCMTSIKCAPFAIVANVLAILCGARRSKHIRPFRLFCMKCPVGVCVKEQKRTILKTQFECSLMSINRAVVDIIDTTNT
jgi:hypothetical protein